MLYGFGMAKAAKKRNQVIKRYTWRDESSGRYHDVTIADPPVKPKGVSIHKIREAVRKSGGGSSAVRRAK
jgi:hypothetical protein